MTLPTSSPSTTPRKLKQHKILRPRREEAITRETRDLQPPRPQHTPIIRHHPRDARTVRRAQQRLPVIRARDIKRLAGPGEIEAVGRDLEDLIDDALGVVVDDVVADDVAQTPRRLTAGGGFLRPDEPGNVGPAPEWRDEVAHLGGGAGR